MPTKTFLATCIGTRLYLRRYTYSSNPCTKDTYGHDAKVHLKDVFHDDEMRGRRFHEVEEFDDSEFPSVCVHCGESFVGTNQVLQKRMYDTASGDLEPGAMFWNDWLPENYYWDNHIGAHLTVVLPNGREWNIDARASNCTIPDDRLHRCWVRHGLAPEITVDKSGHTCSAGGGSILIEDYHGFLRNGHLT